MALAAGIVAGAMAIAASQKNAEVIEENAEFQAQQHEQNAEITARNAALSKEDRLLKLRAFLAENRAAAASSGISLVGSAEAIERFNMESNSRSNRIIDTNRDIAIDRSLNAAGFTRRAGAKAAHASLFSGASSAAGSIGGAIGGSAGIGTTPTATRVTQTAPGAAGHDTNPGDQF